MIFMCKFTYLFIRCPSRFQDITKGKIFLQHIQNQLILNNACAIQISFCFLFSNDFLHADYHTTTTPFFFGNLKSTFLIPFKIYHINILQDICQLCRLKY